MTDTLNFLNLEEVDELSIEQLYQDVEQKLDDEKSVVIPPGTHNVARNWVYAHQKLGAEVDRLKDEYIPFLMERYIKPVKDKIERHKNAQEIIKEGLKDFLNNIQETKVNFPDLATVYMQKGSEKIVYPENEEELAKSLHEVGSDYVRVSTSLNKSKISSDYKETGKLPIPELSIEKTESEVRFRKAKV